MRTPRLLSLHVVAIVSASCFGGDIVGAGGDLTHAAATAQCGPADGPAVAIYLSPAPLVSLEPAPPYVRIDVWQPLERLPEQRWTLNGVEATGSAVYYSGATDPEIASSGYVTVSEVAPDNTIEGFAEINFPTNGSVRRRFTAVWISRSLMCG